MKKRTIENNSSINMWGYSKISPNFKFKEKISKTIDCSYGICNTFDTFISPKTHQSYILFYNKIDTVVTIYIYSMIKKDTIKKLSPCIHTKDLRLLKYFTNKSKKREIIISADCDGILCIWAYNNNNYFLKQKINTYQNDIYSCLILFKNDNYVKIDDDYIIFGCESISEEEAACTKVYSINKGNHIRNVIASNKEKIRNLLMWYNKKNKESYLICLALDKIIIINFLKNKKEKELITNEKNTYNCGIIYNETNEEKKEKNYLCCASSTGHVLVFDLEEGSQTCDIFLKPNIHRVYDILPWNENYFIVADTLDNGFIVFGYKNGGKIIPISNITGLDEDDIECIRKINHPEYGECIVTGSHKNIIKIFGYISDKF